MDNFKPKNNFDQFKADFKKDTNLDWDENIDKYIIYYNARCSDNSAQMLAFILDEIQYYNDNK